MNKVLFLKWIKNLFYIACADLVILILGFVPVLEPVSRWGGNILAIAVLYCLYQLIPVNGGYQKAVIFSGISTVLTLLSNIVDIGLLSLGIVVCALVGIYHEFYSHAEVLLTIDNKLSKKWNTFFMWNVFGPFIVAIAAPLLLIIPIITQTADENVISQIATMIGAGFTVILQLIYIKYLKNTHDVCENYEHWEEDPNDR